jgi:hypothetical protein
MADILSVVFAALDSWPGPLAVSSHRFDRPTAVVASAGESEVGDGLE